MLGGEEIVFIFVMLLGLYLRHYKVTIAARHPCMPDHMAVLTFLDAILVIESIGHLRMLYVLYFVAMPPAS